MFDPVIFREYDIRGVYKEQFNTEFAENLGRAYVTFLNDRHGIKNPKVCIGHDARLSCPDIVAALAKGLQSCGAHVVHLGLVTTPMCYFSTFELEGVNGAIQVTGSHNPPEYNGFKISVGKTTIFGADILALREIMGEQRYLKGEGLVSQIDISEKYLARYKEEFGNLGNLNVVLDCGNGAAGAIVRRLFAAVGMNPEILFEKPDGTFPNHHPDPTVEKNLKDLSEAVLAKGAVCGIGFDGDADRIGVVDHTGKMIYGDELMVIYARAILEKSKGQKIIGDVKCSDRMYNDIAARGGVPVMWKTGHSLVKEKIKVEKAPFGGEMSGHIFFADRNYGYDDAPYAALRLCEILAKSGKTITQLLEGLPPAFNTPEIRIDTTEEKKLLIVEKMKEAFGKPSDDYRADLTDGIRLSFKEGWALCRSSNTQPVLVLRYEATSLQKMEEIQAKVESVVNRYL